MPWHVAPLAGLTVSVPGAPEAAPAPAPAEADHRDAPPAADRGQGAVTSTSSEQQQITDSSAAVPPIVETETLDVAVVEAGQSAVSDAELDNSHAKIEQDLFQPPHYDVEDAMSLHSAVFKLVLMGLPLVAALALIAIALWRQMQSGVHRFSPVIAHEI